LLRKPNNLPEDLRGVVLLEYEQNRSSTTIFPLAVSGDAETWLSRKGSLESQL
jgi:hypothetical protein